MICSHCRDDDHNACWKLNSVPDQPGVTTSGRWCDCQHMPRNPSRVERPPAPEPQP